MKSRLLHSVPIFLSWMIQLVPEASAQVESPQVGVRYVNSHASDSLVAYWKFDELGTTSARSFPNVDLVTSITVGGSITSTQIAPTTTPNPGSLLIDGSTNNVQIADNAAASGLTNLGSNLSIAAWIRRDRLNGGVDTIYTNGETNAGFNAALPVGLLTDLAGHQRFIGGTVDIGAYEAVAATFLPLVIK